MKFICSKVNFLIHHSIRFSQIEQFQSIVGPIVFAQYFFSLSQLGTLIFASIMVCCSLGIVRQKDDQRTQKTLQKFCKSSADSVSYLKVHCVVLLKFLIRRNVQLVFSVKTIFFSRFLALHPMLLYSISH